MKKFLLLSAALFGMMTTTNAQTNYQGMSLWQHTGGNTSVDWQMGTDSTWEITQDYTGNTARTLSALVQDSTNSSGYIYLPLQIQTQNGSGGQSKSATLEIHMSDVNGTHDTTYVTITTPSGNPNPGSTDVSSYYVNFSQKSLVSLVAVPGLPNSWNKTTTLPTPMNGWSGLQYLYVRLPWKSSYVTKKITFEFTTSANSNQTGDDFRLRLISGTRAVLPITLSEFTVSAHNNTNVLNWATQTEKNFSHFEIQKSSNGSEWNTMAEVSGKGPGNYSYVDRQPFTTTYYRLKSVDLDGTTSFSMVRVISNDNSVSGSTVVISLNSVATTTKNNYDINQPINYSVYDMSGRMIKNGSLTTDTKIEANVPTGIYVIRLFQGQTAEAIKLNN